MFYIKTKLAGGKVAKIDITDENVFTKCQECGRELPVDLFEVLSDGESDLFSTTIVCSACTKKRIEKRKHINEPTITDDGLTLLLSVLCRAGYIKQVYNLFDRFEVQSVSELASEQLRPFANALSDIAMEGGGL